ncbi:hypothetical protein [Micromonospora sp. NPDC005174]|uniref:hypothetical protein n=1 Tax=Micromonospora sp. NPDC005174 TaxID=3157018 RepID=UPI0033AC4E89
MPGVGGLPSREAPEWAPLRENVADYVPHRTLARRESTTTAGEDVYYLTFDSDTRPTGWAVDRLIGDGIAYITGQVSPLHVSLQATAAVIATLYAAAAVERSWPNDDQSLQRANDMEKRMADMLVALVSANDRANGGDGEPGDADKLMLAYSFPAPVAWGDSYL